MRYIYLIITLILVTSCKENSVELEPGHYRILGEVKGMNEGDLFLFSKGPDGYKTDTVKVIDGNFVIDGKIPGIVETATLASGTDFRQQPSQVNIYLEPAVIKMKLDMASFENTEFSGTKLQEEVTSLSREREQLASKYNKELQAFQANRDLYDKATTEEEKKALKWKDDDLRNDLTPYYEEMSATMLDFIRTHPQSYVSFNNFYFSLNDLSAEEAKSIYAKFPEEFKKGEFAERIEKDIEDMAKGVPGALAGDFNTIDISGNPIRLSDFKGQYLLIDFWASWCVPCRKGNPHLLDLYAKYNPKGLEILGVSDDDSNPDAWRKAVKDDGIGVWRHVLRGMKVDRSNGSFKLLDDGVSDGYNISSLPTKILVGPDGVVVGRYSGSHEDEEALDRKLAEIF
ncbi:TlpA disulfide reductase family protein [Robertkochia solimangrovi]|uniref:TlpA disulfide reductase family protein n=1 Tax=Robertkochia solimangrovi TaxID=2213046 RepID=UPI001180B66C|nr:TlpA disulfide reductase family protein [Robertkochia solimangrovi]TRZ41981.1 AhpC/TSA family protein [Robertkochia solimangrovi]